MTVQDPVEDYMTGLFSVPQSRAHPCFVLFVIYVFEG